MDERFEALKGLTADTVLLKKAWLQLAKDVMLSGVSGFPDKMPEKADDMFMELTAFVKLAKCSNPNWFKMNYHIDLPRQIDPREISDEQYAKLILYRGLQKVWLRMKFSEPNGPALQTP